MEMEAIKPVVLLTGGSRGIGKEISKYFFNRNVDLCFTYRQNEVCAQQLESELLSNASNDSRITGFKCDMTNMEEVTELVKTIKKKYGTIDILVNNAGVLGETKPFLFANDERWFDTLNTNIKCVTNTCKRVLPLMIRKRSGRIINLTSLAGKLGNPGQSAYAASKAAIVAFTKSLYREVSPMGIMANCVSPGLVATDMTKNINKKYIEELTKNPLERMAYPEEVANLVVYLAMDAPDYMLGQELVLDGGLGVS